MATEADQNRSSISFQRRNYFVECSDNNIITGNEDGFHSPIVSSARNNFIDIDDFKISAIPEVFSMSSLKVKPKPLFDSLGGEFEILSARECGTNSDSCCDNKNYDYNPYTNSNLHCISFDDSSSDKLSSDEETHDVRIDDMYFCDYEEIDIELMQEALSLLFGDEEEKFSSANRCGHHDKYVALKNRFRRDEAVATKLPVRSTIKNHYDSTEVNYTSTAAKDNQNINDTENTISIDHYPLLLPKVTFDEDEVFDRNIFSDEEETSHLRPKIESGVPIVSPEPKNEPSQWLLRQLSSDALSFQPLLNDSAMNGEPMSRPNRRINKGIIRASKETKHKHWSEEEDKTLKMGVETEQLRPVDWIKIARIYFNNTRSATQCKNRWKNYLKPGIKRGNWHTNEDDYIINMVCLGFKWVDIAKGLPGRTGEHVRERYVNVLDNKLKKTCWTAEEDEILFRQQRILGNKWSEIRKLLPGRSDNSIKNRYHNKRNAHLRRLKRETLKKESNHL